ncbi:MAG: glycerol kinase [Alphaproteobacteria bacterium]|nr:glycerol kinase [Alphaproteobacteria bacterium]
MAAGRTILAIDQGTTSTRAMIFDGAGAPRGRAQKELPQIFPGPGWVEHDPEEIWRATIDVCRGAVADAKLSFADVEAIGITNQRETTILWDRTTGQPVHNAIVWQDRRTADICDRLRRAGHGNLVQGKTGLLLDPYFSATKLAWLLDNVPGARGRAVRGELAFGTIDCFLLWRLTGGKNHATDATNAARTMLFDIHRQIWDGDLLRLFDIPAAILPNVRDCAADFGATASALFGRSIPIAGIAGDQQAATIGQTCLKPGMMKSTYGTGCFALLNTGSAAVPSTNRLLTTIAYRLAGKTTYALEGSIFMAGAAMQWLRDGLKLIRQAGDSEALAGQSTGAGPDGKGVYLVPAFTGLGAPYWDAHARGAILGLTRDSGIADIVRAALEAVCYQTRDLMGAMTADGAAAPVALRVDGGMVANNWAMQFLADILDLSVERPAVTETTALGAAYLAGLHTGLYPSLDGLAKLWRAERGFQPAMGKTERAARYRGWLTAVQRVRTEGATV